MRELTTVSEDSNRPHRTALVAAGVLVAVASLLAHYAGHAFVSSTTGLPMPSDVEAGLVSAIDDGGALLVGLGGMLGNLLVVALGWPLLRAGRGRPDAVTVVGWLMVVFNLWLLAGYAVLSPIVEVGDWMVIVDRFPNRMPMRTTIVITGLFSLGLAWRASAHLLPLVVGNGRAKVRTSRARTVVRWSWLGFASVAVTVASSGVPVVFGAIATTWPILFSPRVIERSAVPGEPLSTCFSRSIVAAAAVACMALGAAIYFGWRPAG